MSLAISSVWAPHPARANTLTVAAASSLKFALDEIASGFSRETGIEVRVSYGASGNIARQIRQGAPFELFLSADESYVLDLAEQEVIPDAGRIYARGQLALFARPSSPLQLADGLGGLSASARSGKLGRVAMANPDHAPYGRAAREALQWAGAWELLQPLLVFGENAGQAARFAVSGSTDAALLPLSLAQIPAVATAGAYQPLPAASHGPINHRMAILAGAAPSATEFFEYVLSDRAQAVLLRSGFAPPP